MDNFLNVLFIFYIIFNLFIFGIMRSRMKKTHEEVIDVYATVTKKEYYPPKVAYYPATDNHKYMSLSYDDEEYFIKITYCNVSVSYNSKELFDKFNEGDYIPMTLHSYFSKKGRLLYQTMNVK